MKKNLTVETHENISLEYETANLGSRAIAFIFDYLIQFIALVLIILVSIIVLLATNKFTTIEQFINSNILSTLESVIMVAVFLFSSFFYFFIMELTWHGQTLGKKIAKIKVVSVTGEPINLLMCLIRNLMRIIDFLPAANFIGCIFIVLNKNSQRIGDITANTVVIKTKRYESFSKKLDLILNEQTAIIDKSNSYSNPTVVEGQPTITEHEYLILKQYIQLRLSVTDFKKYDIRLYKYFIRKTQQAPVRSSGYDIFASYLIEVLQNNEAFYNSKGL